MSVGRALRIHLSQNRHIEITICSVELPSESEIGMESLRTTYQC